MLLLHIQTRCSASERFWLVCERLPHLTPPVNDLVNFQGTCGLAPGQAQCKSNLLLNIATIAKACVCVCVCVTCTSFDWIWTVQNEDKRNMIMCSRCQSIKERKQPLDSLCWLLCRHLWPHEGSVCVLIEERNNWITSTEKIHDDWVTNPLNSKV